MTESHQPSVSRLAADVANVTPSFVAMLELSRALESQDARAVHVMPTSRDFPHRCQLGWTGGIVDRPITGIFSREEFR